MNMRIIDGVFIVVLSAVTSAFVIVWMEALCR